MKEIDWACRLLCKIQIILILAPITQSFTNKDRFSSSISLWKFQHTLFSSLSASSDWRWGRRALGFICCRKACVHPKKKNVNKVKSKAVSENASTICIEIPLNVICFIKKLIQVLLRLYIEQTLGPVLQARKDDREFLQFWIIRAKEVQHLETNSLWEL